MTATMQAQAQQTIADNVYKYTLLLIEALKDDYRKTFIGLHQGAIKSLKSTYGASGDTQAEYHLRQVNRLKNGECGVEYTIETGKKYHKVIMITSKNQRSVHCFIDKNTGELYKSSSWKSPAKGVRYDLRLIKDREWLFENADWSGDYTYAR